MKTLITSSRAHQSRRPPHPSPAGTYGFQPVTPVTPSLSDVPTVAVDFTSTDQYDRRRALSRSDVSMPAMAFMPTVCATPRLASIINTAAFRPVFHRPYALETVLNGSPRRIPLPPWNPLLMPRP